LYVHIKIHRGTWKTPDGNAINHIDHTLIDARHRSNLLDVRAFRGANVDSDHYLTGSKIRARISRSRLEKGARMEKFNVDLLKNESTTRQYAESMAELLDQCPIEINDTSNINDNWKSLKMCITSAVDEVIGKAPQERKKESIV
jgi:hypothetical protein